MPQPTLAMPQPMLAMPQPTLAMPQPTLAMPQPTLAMPQPTFAMPQPIFAILQRMVAIPPEMVAIQPRMLAMPQSPVPISQREHFAGAERLDEQDRCGTDTLVCAGSRHDSRSQALSGGRLRRGHRQECLCHISPWLAASGTAGTRIKRGRYISRGNGEKGRPEDYDANLIRSEGP